jgi:protein TonB
MRSQIVSALAVLTLFACTNTAAPAGSASSASSAPTADTAPPPPAVRRPIHGTVARDVVAPPAEYADVPVYEPHAPMTEPAVISRVVPAVPPNLAGQSASVAVEAVVNADGRVAAAWVVEGDPRFAKAATDAVQQWQFRPATVDGKPVRMRYRVTVPFG